MTDRTSKNLSKFPRYGWKVKLDHEFPEYRDQNLRPRLKQLLPLIPLGLRYLKWWTGSSLILVADSNSSNCTILFSNITQGSCLPGGSPR